MNSILLVDANNLLHRVLHVPTLAGLSTSSGLPTGGVYGFIKSLRATLDLEIFSDCLVVWDYGKSRRRMTIFSDYKSNRSVPSSDKEGQLAAQAYFNVFNSQRWILKSLLARLGVKEIQLKNREADDLIWWARKAYISRDSSRRCTIMSEDKDFVQMVDQSTKLHRPIANQTIDFSNFSSLIGVPPEKFLLYKSITGDVGDGIPGIIGVGSTTASVVANNSDWDTFESYCLNHKSKRFKLIADNSSIVRRNLELVDLSLEVIHEEEQEVISNTINSTVCRDFKYVLQMFSHAEFNSIISTFGDWVVPFRRLI